MKIIKRIMCFLALHDWMYSSTRPIVKEGELYFIESESAVCVNCGKRRSLNRRHGQWMPPNSLMRD